MGAGFKTFTAGSILTASDVQNYLQDQSVMVFGGTAARSSAIGTANFEEGMLTYLTDVDKLQVYTGASFVDVYPAAATNQGLTLINTTSFSGVASQSVNDVFSATYDTYRIIFYRDSAVTSGSGTSLRLRVSSTDLASGYNYAKQLVRSNNSFQTFYVTSETAMYLSDSSDSVGKAVIIDITNPFRSTSGTDKTFQFSAMGLSSGFNYVGNTFGWVDSATSYTGFSLINDTGNMTGSVSVYGFNK